MTIAKLRRSSAHRQEQNLPFRLVLVTWEDSARPIGAWQWLDEYNIPQIVRCVSVGLLDAETNSALSQP